VGPTSGRPCGVACKESPLVHRADGPTDPTSSLDLPARADGARSRPWVEWDVGRTITSTPRKPRYLIASRDVLGSRWGNAGPQPGAYRLRRSQRLGRWPIGTEPGGRGMGIDRRGSGS